ncbi:2-hydroxyacid dehydrogenase [Sphingobium herbicidovorans NBRC 16415]|jgi:glyoxylate reductase|uniref:2-hydroxyacid dehydrogenase n=1 Tax=Sphingobium herbicidovorans (strain ATCC 700291 / DSM 11019 / CCUG 56400 / KCTC 2939 / LMG 18315 / NBRC 16415 / MH) TaxID=1219045 RepID=A0A086PFD7_SPHHM|nr:D-glycerate dehydrogenase [Sphingobium herbicidovorans]KFG92105.1 2-hydroxyacid dehydrogenase [Sphingobium herbicidovorans NBRC 16415]
MAKKPRPAKPRVVVTRRLPPNVEARMAELFDTVFNVGDVPMDRTALTRAMAQCDVLVPAVTDQIDAALIDAAPDRLQLIASFGSGVDHIDLGAARRRGIIVTNTPGVLTEDTADMTMALILSVPRRLAEGEKLVRTGEWPGWSPSGMLGHRIGGKKLGIIGMGRIGRAVAKRAAAFGLSIAYHNRHRMPFEVEQELAAEWRPDLDSLLRESDIVSINCPLNADSRGMIDARSIALMRPDAYLINTSRAEITDEPALIAALAEGRIAGAGLDVYTHEPAVDPRLLALSNVVLLPHMGSATFEGRDATGARVIANIRSWVDGHRPPNQVLEGWI